MALRRADLNQISRAVKYISNNKPVKIDGPNPYTDTDKIAHKIKQKQKRLSADEATELITLYKSGMTVYELADKYKCHRTTISVQLKNNGVKMRMQSLSDEQVDKAVELYCSGQSCSKIGNALKASPETIRQALIRSGIKLRSPHG